VAKKAKPSPTEKLSSTKTSKMVNLAQLPLLNNAGLKYLPTMQYFPPGQPCPLEPVNVVDGPKLCVLIHLMSGGFKCMAFPLEAVEKDKEK
jgi:hypothetical protein